jgi:hypothetical protein
MNLDFDFMIKNHPEFFTKLSSQNFDHPLSPTPRPFLPASGAILAFLLGWLTRVSQTLQEAEEAGGLEAQERHYNQEYIRQH